MDRRYTYVFLVSLFIFLSCKNKNEDQLKYERNLELFPKFMVDYFPKRISYPYMTSKTVDTKNRCISFLLYSFNDNDTQEIKRKLEMKYKKKYISNDPMLITVKKNTLFEWNYKRKNYYKDIKRKGNVYYPIMYFESEDDIKYIGANQKSIYSSSNESGLSDDFTIYVCDSKPGVYWKGLKELDYMPTGWKNGYSKGVCLNEKEHVVICWFVIW